MSENKQLTFAGRLKAMDSTVETVISQMGKNGTMVIQISVFFDEANDDIKNDDFWNQLLKEGTCSYYLSGLNDNSYLPGFFN